MNGIGNRVKFTCNRGYKTETGEMYTTCEETGHWSITPKCLELKCPTDWLTFRESCYKMGTYKEIIDNAKAECERDGAHLVHIDDEDENKFIKDFVQETQVWIGLEKSGQSWTWIDDNTRSSFVDWVKSEDQPRMPISRKCATINGDGWRSAICNLVMFWEFQPICEKPKQ